jgi:hypothetical protein
MKIKTSRDICLFFAAINIPIYIIGGGAIALTTSLIMFASCILLEIADKNV